MDDIQAFLSDPNVAFALFVIGALGIAIEVVHPNAVTGVLGAVAIRETDKLAGSFATTAETAAVRDAMETWSRLVFDALVEGDATPG